MRASQPNGHFPAMPKKYQLFGYLDLYAFEHSRSGSADIIESSSHLRCARLMNYVLRRTEMSIRCV
jgi:hypothetical protein